MVYGVLCKNNEGFYSLSLVYRVVAVFQPCCPQWINIRLKYESSVFLETGCLHMAIYLYRIVLSKWVNLVSLLLFLLFTHVCLARS